MDQIELKQGQWEAGSRNMDYNPYFEINPSDTLYSDIDTEVVMLPKSEFQDFSVSMLGVQISYLN